ncbi:MAG: hypothetical protein ACLQU2_12890 [Candidatus Binataceae bacterium]
MTGGGIALVVAVFVIVMAMVGRLESANKEGGSGGNLILVRNGATTETGGALGAGTGFVVGNELQNGEIRNARTQSQVSAQQREINSQRTDIERLKQQQETE